MSQFDTAISEPLDSLYQLIIVIQVGMIYSFVKMSNCSVKNICKIVEIDFIFNFQRFKPSRSLILLIDVSKLLQILKE